MKTLLFLTSLIMMTPSDPNPCELKGRVRVVSNFADYKVFINNGSPDVNVQIVQNFPNNPGQWQIVERFEDFSIQYVTNRANADFEVKFVEKFPRCRK